MKVLQCIALIILYLSLFQDWGGYGSPFILRVFSTNWSNNPTFGIIILAVCILFTFFVVVNKKNFQYKFWRVFISFIFVIIASGLALLSYGMSNLLVSENKEFDGSATAAVVLAILFITFIFDLKRFSKLKN